MINFTCFMKSGRIIEGLRSNTDFTDSQEYLKNFFDKTDDDTWFDLLDLSRTSHIVVRFSEVESFSIAIYPEEDDESNKDI